jgi:hypothetical protein
MASRYVAKSAVDMEKAINAILDEYGDEVKAETLVVMEAVADQTVKKLKTVKHHKTDRATGKYDRGWRYETERLLLGGVATIHNKVYQLTHLLNDGHAKRGGGRVEGDHHIDNAEKEAVETYEEYLDKGLKKL